MKCLGITERNRNGTNHGLSDTRQCVPEDLGRKAIVHETFECPSCPFLLFGEHCPVQCPVKWTCHIHHHVSLAPDKSWWDILDLLIIKLLGHLQPVWLGHNNERGPSSFSLGNQELGHWDMEAVSSRGRRQECEKLAPYGGWWGGCSGHIMAEVVWEWKLSGGQGSQPIQQRTDQLFRGGNTSQEGLWGPWGQSRLLWDSDEPHSPVFEFPEIPIVFSQQIPLCPS